MKKRVISCIVAILFIILILSISIKIDNTNSVIIKDTNEEQVIISETDDFSNSETDTDPPLIDVDEIEDDEFEILINGEIVDDEDNEPHVYEGPDPFSEIDDDEKDDNDNFVETIIETPEGNLTFYVYENECELYAYVGDDEYVSIPSTVNGKPVTKIGNAAFFAQRNIKGLEIPDTVRVIGSSAFYDVPLTEISLPDNLEKIGSDAFELIKDTSEKIENTEKAITVHIGKNVQDIKEGAFKNTFVCSFDVDSQNPYFTSVDGILYSKDMKQLIEYPIGKTGDIIIPEGVERIPNSAFVGRMSHKRENGRIEIINDLFLPDSLVSFSSKAIEDSNIGTVHIGKNLKEWDSISAVSGIDFVVSEENPYFTTKNNMLFDKEKKTLLYCMDSSINQLVIPDCVEYIDVDSLKNCPDSIQKIHIGKSLISSVDGNAGLSNIFCKLNNLTEITVSKENTNLMSVDGVLFDYKKEELITYPNNKKGNEYEIPEGVQLVQYGAFYGNDSLNKIVLPNSYIFDSEDLGQSFVNGFKNLCNVETKPDNEVYISKDSMLINKNTNTLLFIFEKNQEVLYIPEGIKIIAPSVFSERSIANLMEIHIPESVEIIGKNNFVYISSRNQWDVANVYIPNGQTKISKNAFDSCDGITVNTEADSYVEKVMNKHQVSIQYLQ